MEETVTISRTEYIALKRAEAELAALNNAGVDNWDRGYYAGKEFRRFLKENPEFADAFELEEMEDFDDDE
jgi:hypothetical protein